MALTEVNSLGIKDLEVKRGDIAADAIDGTKLADDAIDSEHYVDGSIDHAHLAGDCVDGDNIQDDVINSEHIAAGAVDLEHMSSESVDEDNLHISNAGSNGQYLQKQSGNTGGLTWATPSAGNPLIVADRWRMNANSTDGSEMVITAWERNDTAAAEAGFLGTGLTVSSGVFTFPQTGIWYITFHGVIVIGSSNDTQAEVVLKVTDDGGTGWVNGTVCMCGDSDNSVKNSVSMDYLIDVENVSDDKVKIETDSFSSNTYLEGDSDADRTTITFIRLGDT